MHDVTADRLLDRDSRPQHLLSAHEGKGTDAECLRGNLPYDLTRRWVDQHLGCGGGRHRIHELQDLCRRYLRRVMQLLLLLLMLLRRLGVNLAPE